MSATESFPCADPDPVLCVGPPLDAVGGMAEVARQMAGMSLGGQYRVIPFESTQSKSASEWRLSKIARHLRHSLRLIAEMRRSRARLVHIHTCSGASFMRSAADLIGAQQRDCPTVLHVHGGGFDRFHEASLRGTRRFIRSILHAADAVIALSGEWQRKLERIAPRANVVVIENAVAIPRELARRAGNRTCNFLFLARMDREKGLLELLDAAGRCASAGLGFELTLAGPPGSLGGEKEIKELIAARSLAECVRYVGSVRDEEKKAALCAADVFVLPSHFEGMPISVLEAMALGLPVITTSVGAIPEVIREGEQGYLLQPGRADLLAEAMMRMASDPSARAAMGSKARRLAESNYSLHRLERELIELYDHLLCGEHVPQGAARLLDM